MRHVPVAYQLYSARQEAEQDLPSVLRRLREIGYDGVEFAGFYGHDAHEIAAMLAQTGLRAVSSHVPLREIEADGAGVIEAHRLIGCDAIAIPALGRERRPGAPGFASVLQTIYRFGVSCRENGMQLLYHNHDFEFTPLSGEYALDFIYDAIPEALLKTELDVCWIRYAGEDPCAYLRKYAGRAPIVHLKDYVGRREDGAAPYGLLGEEEKRQNGGVPFAFRPLGYGCQDMEAIVRAGVEAGAQWFVVEQDQSPDRPALEAAAMSLETLRKIGVKA